MATEADSVYAFDADSNAAPLWKASLVDSAHGAGSGETPVSSSALGCGDLQPKVGITSTPVIDSASGTIYVEAKSTNGTNYIHRLHALSLATGSEKAPGPIVIRATVSGTGDGSSGGSLTFDDSTSAGNTMSFHALSRAGLLLLNGTIYISYASHCDGSPYHGWLFAYDEATFTRKSVYLTTPNGGLGGFWMSGAGIAADASGNIFVVSGNGTFDTTNVPARETGDTVLKLGTTNQNLALLDYFTPQDQQSLESNDSDVGSGGVLLLPDQPGTIPHILVVAGKEGRVYVINRDTMTTSPLHYCSGCSSDPEILEESSSGFVGPIFGMPAYWNNTLYFWSDTVRMAIPITNGRPNFSSVTTGSYPYGYPGATPSITSNGTTSGTAIVWAIDASAFTSLGPAVVHAYDATNISHELWNSSQAANDRDRAGSAVKFSVPTIVNGKAYVGTSTEIDVYGLLGGGTTITTTTASPLIAPGSETVSSPVSVTITDATASAKIYYTTDGSTPSSTHGTLYQGAFTESSSWTIQAMAVASGDANSGIATATYTIQPSVASSINYSSGMTSSGLALQGSAAIVGSRLRLTNGGTEEAGSGFASRPVNIDAFTSDFTFQLTNPNADGFTFAIHGGTTAAALGPLGGGLGYGPGLPGETPGIGKSVAVKFDLYNNDGEGTDSTGEYTNGASPTIPFVNMSGTAINLHSGDTMQVQMTYDGTNLAMTITDTVTHGTFSHTFPVNIPSIVGSSTAFVGFTGGTGGSTATQDIINWTFTSTTATAKVPVIYQTEALMGASVSSGPDYRVFDWTGFTNGVGTTLDATAAGQYVTITLPVAAAGTYDVKFGVKMHNTRGVAQLSINGTNVGAAADEYSATDVFKEFDLGTVSLAAGSQPFKFTVTGKDAASAGFTLSWDYIKLTPQ